MGLWEFVKNLVVKGDLEVKGKTTFHGDIDSDLNPRSSCTKDLGTPTKRWRDAWFNGEVHTPRLNEIRFSSEFATGSSSGGIIEAIADLPGSSGTVVVTNASPITVPATGVPLPSNVTVYLAKGVIVKLPNGVNADASVFHNSDQVNGDVNIHILGEGLIDGNEDNQNAGRQFGIKFVKVKESSIDVYIRRCRTSDMCLIDSNIPAINKRFNPSSDVIISDFEGAAEWTVETGAAVRNATYYTEGAYSWKLTPGGAPPTVRISKAIALDISSHYLVIRMRSTDRVHCARDFYIRFYSGARYFEGHFTSTGAGDSYLPYVANEWMIYTFTRGDFTKMNGAVEGDWENIDTVKIEIGSDVAGHEIYLDDFRAIRCVNQGVATITFDDCFPEEYTIGFPLMTHYGYKATMFAVTQQVAGGGWGISMNMDQVSAVSKAGWDIASHLAYHDSIGPALVSDAHAVTWMLWAKEWLLSQGYKLGALFMAYPNGSINRIAERVYALSRASTALTSMGITDIGPVIPWLIRPTRPLSLGAGTAAIDKCIKYHAWPVFLFHQPDPTWFSDFVEYMHDNGANVMSMGEVYEKYRDLLCIEGSQQIEVDDSLKYTDNIAMGVSNVYGAVTNVYSRKGRIVTPRLKITIGGTVLGAETITVKIQTFFFNNVSLFIEKTFNAKGEYWLNDADWLTLWTTPWPDYETRQCKYLIISAKSDQAVTNGTVATDVIA